MPTRCLVCFKPDCSGYSCIPSFFGKPRRPLGPPPVKLRPRLLQESPGRFYRPEAFIEKDEALIAQGENDKEEGRCYGR